MSPGDSCDQVHPSVEEVIAWVTSPEGEEALKEAGERSNKIIKELEEARKPDRKELQESMDFPRRPIHGI